MAKLERVTLNTCYGQGGPLVGIFVKSLDGIHNHVGFVFFFEQKVDGKPIESGTRRLDFMTNEMVISRNLGTSDTGLFHAAMKLDGDDATLLAAYLSAVSCKLGPEPPILYGMTWNDGRTCFDAEGNYTNSYSVEGLSCATFMDVLIANGLGAPAVKYLSWLKNEKEDLAWRKKKLEGFSKRLKLGTTKVTEAQILAMASIDPFIRLRPEQIAAAALTNSDTWPLEFSAAQVLADEVIKNFMESNTTQ